MNWYIAVLKNYVGFSGRARRQEFWWFTLINVVVEVVLYLVDNAIGSQILGGIYGLAILLPAIAVAVRRLHDTGRSAWWLLLYFTCIGWIVLLVFWILEGNQGQNKYGDDPKLVPAQV
ncbi:DUF805 domain-containing protein [Streptacidiphilus melanogenes]|uniref:DUF805 domain-containing protein n=1 Tax=Streptacidiphilus melanogenes TaxID=411235 RepID=UPI0005A951E9|nr:DUF805 domain-containing protein [Streptacidiphilus melanogenes]